MHQVWVQPPPQTLGRRFGLTPDGPYRGEQTESYAGDRGVHAAYPNCGPPARCGPLSASTPDA